MKTNLKVDVSQCSFSYKKETHENVIKNILVRKLINFLAHLLYFCLSFAHIFVALSPTISDEAVQWQKSPGKWNETDLDMSYERKPHHTYDS